MVVYHGTTLENAEMIKREGLRPKPESVFRTTRSDYDYGTLGGQYPNKVYITPDPKIAEMFALFRARYEKAKTGEEIKWGDIYLKKLSPEIHPTAKPAIVKITLPDSWKSTLEIDYQTEMYGGLTHDGPIPPEYVSDVIPVKGTWKADTAYKLAEDYVQNYY